MKLKRIVYAWRTVKHGVKFAKKGRHCRFPGKYLEVDGHVELGDNCRFRNNVILRTKGRSKIVFGTYSGCSYNCLIEATKMIVIGSFTGIAEFTVVRDSNHLVFGTDRHWRVTPLISAPIVIGDCVAIMSGCYISPGVAIGDGAIIGQNSVVTKDVGPYEVWAGNPARKIGHRLHGTLADAMMKRYGHLLETQGLKEDRYGYNDDEIREAAAAGLNRAADKRDELAKELGSADLPPDEDE
jgi:acetyltransferase-like isoleucine patch superfamily enzyme